jgi:hypothetical protein
MEAFISGTFQRTIIAIPTQIAVAIAISISIQTVTKKATMKTIKQKQQQKQPDSTSCHRLGTLQGHQ